MADDTVAQLPRSVEEARQTGAKHYFTGRPCKHSHIAWRLTINGTCSECARLRTAAYFKRQSDEERNKRRQRMRDYYRENYETICERGKKWRQANKYRLAEYERQRLWNPHRREQFRAIRAARRAAKRGCKGSFTATDLARLKLKQKFCYICKKKFTMALKPTIDHIVPLALGGQHCASNIMLACRPCNCGKGAKRTHLL